MLAGLVFFIWIVLSIVGQFPSKFMQRIMQHDVFGLLPCWSFFAPNPPVGDYRLLHRRFESGNLVGQWKEVRCPSRSWYSFLWNPDRRIRKAIFDITTALAIEAGELDSSSSGGSIDTNALSLTVPYILALNIAATDETVFPGDSVQFMLQLEKNGALRSHEVMMVSLVHGL